MLLQGGPLMNQHSLVAAIITSGVMATLFASPLNTHAAKPIPRASSAGICESALQRTRPAPKTVGAILQSHAQWVEDRESVRGRRANLCRTDLRGLRLAGANLERINLEGAMLTGTNLRNANLMQAHLKGANLSQAMLDDAMLEGA